MVEEKDTSDTTAPAGASSSVPPQVTHAESLADEVGLARHSAPDEIKPVGKTPEKTPVTKTLYPAAGGPRILGTDIRQIVEDTKLPERKEFRAAADIPVIPPELKGEKPVEEKPPQEQFVPRDKSSIVSMHTLKDDLQSVVRSEKISLVRAAALEEDKRAHRTQEEEQKKRGVHNINVLLEHFSR